MHVARQLAIVALVDDSTVGFTRLTARRLLAIGALPLMNLSTV